MDIPALNAGIAFRLKARNGFRSCIVNLSYVRLKDRLNLLNR